MKKLCDEFYTFNENGEKLSVDFLRRYSRKLMDLMGASDYLHDIKKTILFFHHLACYNYNSEVIYIYINKYIKVFEKEHNIKFNKYNYEHIALLNTHLIISITHECFHGIQKKIADQKDKNNTLEAKIFYDSFDIIIYEKELYKLYYKIIPVEVNAYIMSNIYGVEFINLFCGEEALYNNNSCVAAEILAHYFEDDKYFSPTKLFYQEINEKKRYDSLIKDANASNYERMILGLELDDYYIDSLKDICDGKIEVENIKTYLKNK